MKAGIIIGAAVLALAAVPSYLFIKSVEPNVEFVPVPKAVGGTAKLSVRVNAPHGLRLLTVSIEQGTARAEAKTTEAANHWFFWKRKEAPKTVEISLTLNQQQGFKSGPGILVLRAESNDLRGQAIQRSHSVTVQLEPPRLSVIEDGILYINQGGSAIVKFNAGGGWTEAGVRVGPYSFRSWKRAGAAGEGERFSLFAFPWDVPAETAPVVFARDAAGNEVIESFKHKIFPKHWRKRTLDLDDGFLQKAVTEVNPPTAGSLLDRFLYVNREVRKENTHSLAEMRNKTTPEFLWQQPFKQLANSQVEAVFADVRTYRYGGKEVDQQVHLGFDLSKTKESPVAAANRGKVVFAGRLGIYGNCVVLDHGYGLQSIYGHMSHIEVKEGQMVESGSELGRSGATGLAGGDHLHFSMQLDGTQINPVEWWDPKWIREHLREPLGMAEPKP